MASKGRPEKVKQQRRARYLKNKEKTQIHNMTRLIQIAGKEHVKNLFNKTLQRITVIGYALGMEVIVKTKPLPENECNSNDQVQ